ncbi:MAG: methyltransferase domain-containing protein [Rhodospirillales bacterium]
MTPTPANRRDDLGGLPAAYAAWRESTLGRITDTIEYDLIGAFMGPAKGLQILDVGCGDGVLAVNLANSGAHVTGVDVSERMIEAARARARGDGADISFRVANAGDLPFEDDTFDAVVAVTVLCFVEDPEAAIKEMRRVLKPGGLMIAGELGRFSSWAVVRRVKGWLGSFVWRHARFRSPSELTNLAIAARMTEVSVTGAIFYPPCGIAARLFGSIDRRISMWTTLGAAFLALRARKPKGRRRQESIMESDGPPPILANKYYRSTSAFTPESLLREARRQKGASLASVPAICLLDPDGDIVRELRSAGRARRHEGWVCYHTELWLFELDGRPIGIVGCAVGAAFAVLLAEELFACGCELLISMTSSGQILPAGEPPYFVLIDRALRDEGTSYHYQPPSEWSEMPEHLFGALGDPLIAAGPLVVRGATWTTDAPFRETEEAIAAARAHGILAVEMEAAALYAFAHARDRKVICFAHVTNRMGRIDGDFEKGEVNGTADAFAVVTHLLARFD